ncbi:endonuclease/exonuclease/phosphatase family protein [Desertimonas flava]|jgi:endonuclease/exonuclease/phosphatase (EEP) superfamily protein YafD|uniref:endonuclease/exonuclease/phosphatase family protein n=1 Tax=Desertimonas flava TaxID=2064846 RepID=UPI000E350B96|nr:endonuclease/exonuclease/phosphatase family protein [Desertimonas flava]
MSLLAASSRIGRVVEIAGWAAVAVMVALVVTQIVGWTGHRYVAALQSLVPYVLGLAFPLAAAALVTQRWALAAVAGAVAVALVVMAWPLLRPPAEPAAAHGATPLTVFHANLLYLNTRHEETVDAVTAADADVLAFTEYTPGAAAALHASPLADEYPYRIEYSHPVARGTALWSRYPLSEFRPPETKSAAVLARVESSDPVVVLAVHVTSPLISTDDWSSELRNLDVAPLRDGEPVVIVGDFNATFWHPRFRALLSNGWRDAHQALGRGFSTSWPDDIQPIPNFVRIDHALLNEHAVATAVEDVGVPGSDHVAFVVTLVPAA